LITGEVSFRKAYLSAIVDRIEVGDGLVRIVGRKDVLEQAVLAINDAVPSVRGFVRKWRTGQDSNPRPPDS
jgi:site-specific DNA recombinase